MGLRAPKRVPQGGRVRVLIVDDSVVIRRLVSTALEAAPGLEVVGSAANGRIALQRIPQLNPDVVTLDIEMPDMDGLETLRHIRTQFPAIRVIMFSTLTQRGATATFEALALGADDYATKASNEGSLNRSLDTLRQELVPKIRQFFLWETPRPLPAAGAPAAPAARVAPATGTASPLSKLGPRRAAVVGISTGGPAALSEIVPAFPDTLKAPILIVQHMPPMFTRLLAERLQAKTRLTVREAAEGDAVTGGHIFIAPGDYHMRVRIRDGKPVITLDQGPPVNSCRPAADVLFQSAAEVWGGAVVAAVLTGMGQDGLRGAEQLRALGAHIIAQDEATSVVWGMPGAVVQAGLAHTTAPLRAVASEISRHFI